MANETIGDKIVKADTEPPQEIFWWQSPQVLFACASIGGGAAAFCAAFHIIIPYSAVEIAAGIGGLAAMFGGGFALARRIKAGLDPNNSASTIKLFR